MSATPDLFIYLFIFFKKKRYFELLQEQIHNCKHTMQAKQFLQFIQHHEHQVFFLDNAFFKWPLMTFFKELNL